MAEKNNQHPINHEQGNRNRDTDSRDRASIFDNYADEETSRVREGIQEQRRSMDLASKLFRRPSARQAGVGAFHMTPREEEDAEEREEENDEDPSFQDHFVEAEVAAGSYRYGHSTATPAVDTQSQISIVTLVETHPQINSSQINSLRASSAQAAVITPPNPWEPKERLARICVSFMGIAALITIVLTIMVFTMGDESTDASSDTASNLIPTASPSVSPTTMLNSCSLPNRQIVHSTRYVQLKAVLQKELAQHDPTVFEEPCSPYDLALLWLADEDEMQLIPQAGIAVHQRFGLALFSFTTKMHLMDLSIDLDYQWLSDQGECKWFGVTCANQESHFDIITGISVIDPAFGTVTAIEIRDLVLTGHIPNELGIFLPFLQTLDLANNGLLSGTIPISLFSLQSLVHLNLAKNRFSGRIDQEEWTTQNLEILGLEMNKFVGKIPLSITLLKNLEKLNLSENQFTGSIPRAMYRIPRLKNLNLGMNDALTGTIPNLIRSTNLEELGLNKNKLGGYLPPALFFLSNLGMRFQSLNQSIICLCNAL